MKCNLTKKSSGVFVASGLGSCSSFESKYRWREGKRKCPKCDADTIAKGRDEWGGGWYCAAKKGGCGAKFPDGDKSIEEQIIGRVLNPDLSDCKNTILKMALKRAKVSAVLSATRSSGSFTQDMEDIADHGDTPAQAAAPRNPPPPPPAKTTAAAPPPAKAAPAAAAPPPDASKGKAAATKKAPPAAPPAAAKTAAPPPEQAGPPKANIPPFEDKKATPPSAPGPKMDLKTFARVVANKVHCSPDQTVIFMRRILRTEDLKSAPEGQKIVCLASLFRVADMTWPGGIESVRAFVLNEGLNPDFEAIQTAYSDLLLNVDEELPAA
jgi:hypothetical protein